ncbi:MAG: hypothetical protein GXO09_00960 [Crenarchaeota archaeon]|nr:hypothetical protein [Thermoproteota archaeon]
MYVGRSTHQGASLETRVRRYALGLLLAILVSYLSALGIPVPLTWDRRIKFIVYRGFVTGSPLLDFAVYTAAVILSAGILRDAAPLLLLLEAVGLAGYYTGAGWLLGVAGLLGLVICTWTLRRRGAGWLASTMLRGYLLLTVPAMTVSLIYILGLAPAWLCRRVILSLHVAWSTAAWASIGLLVAAAGYRAWLLIRRRAATSGGLEGSPPPSYWLPAGLTGVGLVLLLHNPSFNPGLLPVSVDTFYYARFLETVRVYGFVEAVRLYPGFARPLFLYMLHVLSRVVGDYVVLLDVVYPAACMLLLAYASSTAAWRLYGACEAGLAAWLAVLGPWAMSFIAAGFHANWLAISLALLMVAASTPIRRILLALLTALVHPWTFLLYAVGDVIYSAARGSGAWERLAAYSAAGLAALSAILYFGGGVSQVAAPAEAVGAVPFPLNVLRGVMLWSWGGLCNPPTLLLAALPAPPLSVMDAVYAFILLLLAPYTPVVAERIILDAPIPILAAHAYTWAEGRGLDTPAWLIVVLVAGYTLTFLAGLTPLHGQPWCSIAFIRGACG